jgi:hypothetical protein
MQATFVSIVAFACCLIQAQTLPAPRVVTPGTDSSPDKPGRPPSDAVVLFDGKDLSHWLSMTKKGVIGEPKWKVENGYMEVARGSGSLVSKEKFGSAQIHVEWATPAEVRESSQRRGNSGVFLMRRWEIQILDSWENPTYAKGEAAALYGTAQPLVNACRKPGEWQTFDIIFDAPVYEGGALVSPPYVTLLHNGVLVQNHVPLSGGRDRSLAKDPYLIEGPLMLQDHPGPVRFRNVWVRPLGRPAEH